MSKKVPNYYNKILLFFWLDHFLEKFVKSNLYLVHEDKKKDFWDFLTFSERYQIQMMKSRKVLE